MGAGSRSRTISSCIRVRFHTERTAGVQSLLISPVRRNPRLVRRTDAALERCISPLGRYGLELRRGDARRGNHAPAYRIGGSMPRSEGRRRQNCRYDLLLFGEPWRARTGLVRAWTLATSASLRCRRVYRVPVSGLPLQRLRLRKFPTARQNLRATPPNLQRTCSSITAISYFVRLGAIDGHMRDTKAWYSARH
jgi:hypothetical protein